MGNPRLLADGDHHVFVCGNDAEAKAQITKLLTADFGWRHVIDLGDISAARGTEAFLLIWRRIFGALQTPPLQFQNRARIKNRRSECYYYIHCVLRILRFRPVPDYSACATTARLYRWYSAHRPPGPSIRYVPRAAGRTSVCPKPTHLFHPFRRNSLLKKLFDR